MRAIRFVFALAGATPYPPHATRYDFRATFDDVRRRSVFYLFALILFLLAHRARISKSKPKPKTNSLSFHSSLFTSICETLHDYRYAPILYTFYGHTDLGRLAVPRSHSNEQYGVKSVCACVHVRVAGNGLPFKHQISYVNRELQQIHTLTVGRVARRTTRDVLATYSRRSYSIASARLCTHEMYYELECLDRNTPGIILQLNFKR